MIVIINANIFIWVSLDTLGVMIEKVHHHAFVNSK